MLDAFLNSPFIKPVRTSYFFRLSFFLSDIPALLPLPLPLHTGDGYQYLPLLCLFRKIIVGINK